MERIVNTLAITALIRPVTNSTEAALMVVFTENRAIKVHSTSYNCVRCDNKLTN